MTTPVIGRASIEAAPPPGARPRWRAVADAVLALIVAPPCAACDRPLEHPTDGAVCAACWSAIRPFAPPLCAQCGDPLPSWRVLSIDLGRCPRCRRYRSTVTAARAIGAYDGTLRDIVQAIKYGQRQSLAVSLSTRMRLAASDVLEGADVAIPVPLHRRRQRARGFNQAEALARGLGLPVVRALIRARHTPSQTDLPAGQRHANVRGAFRLARRADVNGLCVVLVDDVATTGATLDACAGVLRDAGAREVRAVTAARVVTSQP